MKKLSQNQAKRKDVLVALLKDKSDFAILRDEGWYRIPVASAPRRWPPRWLAFYQPKAFKPEAFRVQYYGEVANIQVLPRNELFPNEFESVRSSNLYYKLSLKSLELREQPILSLRGRRLVFMSTTWEKFAYAKQINDLFDDSPLEDLLWQQFKRLNIMAERQWEFIVEELRFFLDFALFCTKGPIAVETDGDTWHTVPDRANQDYIRQNAIESRGWHVLRFNTNEIREGMESYCLPEIQKTINNQGGLSDEGLVPRLFYPKTGVTQLSLFEERGGYTVDTGAAENLELE
jgi:very-short-patch-repair endonuclease